MASEIRLIKVGQSESSAYSSYRSCLDFDLKGRSEISQIFISGGENGITWIQFQYVENGKYVLSDQYGSYSGSNQFHTIELNHPAEYITGVNGLSSIRENSILVITFTTNIQKYGPFGVSNQTLQNHFSQRQSFTYNLGKSCQFGGFHGTYNNSRLISIGFYLRVKTVTPNIESKVPKKEA